MESLHMSKELIGLSDRVLSHWFPVWRISNHCLGRTGGWLQMNRLKLETSRELPIILEESIEHNSNELKQNRKMSTCNQLHS